MLCCQQCIFNETVVRLQMPQLTRQTEDESKTSCIMYTGLLVTGILLLRKVISCLVVTSMAIRELARVIRAPIPSCPPIHHLLGFRSSAEMYHSSISMPRSSFLPAFHRSFSKPMRSNMGR